MILLHKNKKNVCIFTLSEVNPDTTSDIYSMILKNSLTNKTQTVQISDYSLYPERYNKFYIMPIDTMDDVEIPDSTITYIVGLEPGYHDYIIKDITGEYILEVGKIQVEITPDNITSYTEDLTYTTFKN